MRCRAGCVSPASNRPPKPPRHVELSIQTAANRDINAGFAAARTLLQAQPRPTALICTHERLAVGAVLAAANLGVRIPADLSLVSLDDGEHLAAQLVPRLATIERPDRAMAEQAVTMTLQRFEDETERINSAADLQLLADTSRFGGTSAAAGESRTMRPSRYPVTAVPSTTHLLPAPG